MAPEPCCDLRAHAAAHPQKPAWIMADSGETVTFAALETRANRGARLLRAAGVGVGDHIAILMENRRDYLEICFAADRAGVYYTCLATHLTAPEVAYILADCGARLVVSSPRFAAMLDEIGPACRVLSVGTPPEGVESWDTLAAAQPDTPIPDERQGLDMLYSSGTTGRPKGIKWPLPAQPFGARTMLVELLSGLFGYAADTRYLCPAPLYHAAPLRHSMVTIKMGGTAVIMPRFDAAEALALIERHAITHSQWVPTMFVRLLRLPAAERTRHDLASHRVAVHAAAPCPEDIKRAMIDWWGPILHEYYAGTENNGFCHLDTAEWLAHTGSVGRARQGILHICGPDGEPLPIGEEGEIFFEGGPEFAYHNDPEKTAAARNARGWTTLGDVGRLDADGYLYLTDRKSFVIISGGVNIYPQEAENLLLSHPAVLDAAVIGIPHPDFGEAVHAVVQPAPGHTPSPALAEALIAHCRASLSAIKCPRTLEFRDQLPREANGKLFKKKLIAEYRGNTTATRTGQA